MTKHRGKYYRDSIFESSLFPFYVDILYSNWMPQASFGYFLHHYVKSFKPRAATLLILEKREQNGGTGKTVVDPLVAQLRLPISSGGLPMQ